MGAGAVGEQVELLFFDAVHHVAAGAVQVFVGQRDPVDPLPQHLQRAVFDEILLAVIREARGEPLRQSQPFIERAKQDGAPIRTDVAPLEIRVNGAAPKPLEFQLH